MCCLPAIRFGDVRTDPSIVLHNIALPIQLQHVTSHSPVRRNERISPVSARLLPLGFSTERHLGNGCAQWRLPNVLPRFPF